MEERMLTKIPMWLIYAGTGYMSLVTKPAHHKSHFYNPHHCVLKPSNTTTNCEGF